jgi:hypothetical protein
MSSPFWSSWPDIYYSLIVMVLFLCDAFSDEGAARLCQRSLSRVRVPITVSNLRLHFRHLRQLAGSRWRYSTPPPHGYRLLSCQLFCLLLYTVSGRTTAQKHISCQAIDICKPHRKHPLWHRFYCCVLVLRALTRSGSTLLLVGYCYGVVCRVVP